MKIQSKLLAALLVLSAGTADAATATGNLSVTATVSGTCTLTTTSVAFGTYDPAAGADDTATGAVTVTCTSGTGYTVSLDAGANETTPNDITTRRMKANTSDYLPYQLYQDSGHATAWGDTAGAILTGQTGNGSAQAIDVYGVIVKNQYVAAGSYVDTVVVTVTY
ncbi:MAG: Csu type fimbrial protein [Methylotenera sp.]